jgi:hypothetical protein
MTKTFYQYMNSSPIAAPAWCDINNGDVVTQMLSPQSCSQAHHIYGAFQLASVQLILLTNRHVDTDHILTFLVQDSINGNGCFTRLTVTDN